MLLWGCEFAIDVGYAGRYHPFLTNAIGTHRGIWTRGIDSHIICKTVGRDHRHDTCIAGIAAVSSRSLLRRGRSQVGGVRSAMGAVQRLRDAGGSRRSTWRHLAARSAGQLPARNDPNHWRRQWAGVTLRKGGKFGEDIKLMDLLAFRSEFEVARSFVQDWTQQEEMNLLMQQLPTKWRQRALRREAEEARRTHLVKLQNVDLDQMKLGQVLQHLGLHVVGINMLAGCRHVQLGSDADVQKLLGIPNLLIDGKRVSCQAIRSRWTSERLFSYLQDELRVEQESLVLGGRGNFTGSSPSPPWRPRQAGPQQQQQQPSKVEEIKTAAPRQPDRRPHPAAVAKPRSDAATAGSAKPAASKTPTFTPNSPCWTCERAGRPADHSFKACNHARDAYMKRPQRGLPKPKGH